MVETLKDFQNRSIFTRLEYGIDGVFCLGDCIFNFLRDILFQNLVKSCYFTHYFGLPEIQPHVKVGIRFNTREALTSVNGLLNHLCEEKSKLILNPGNFQTTYGYINDLPEDIVVDYIICYSFEWLVKIKEKFKVSYPSYESLGRFILQNKIKIEEEIIGKHIFRYDISRRLEIEVISKIWERFIHHLCNAYSFQHEPQLKGFLKGNGINIL